jgi:hypothetical protein
MPEVTDVCWMDVAIGDAEPQRVEISLFGMPFCLSAFLPTLSRYQVNYQYIHLSS